MAASEYSPWAVAEDEPPKWRPGEQKAACALVGICFFLVVDVNIAMIRVFKKRKGLYYWSMLFGIWGCIIDLVGVILRYLASDTKHLWGLYTVCLLGGWTIYAPAQLLVLYSRLHLVNENSRVQKGILVMILSTFITLILPTWVVVWPAYDPDPAISSVWSPRDAIVERYTQIGFTLAEGVVSGVYIWSLLKLLKFKSSVRQRRVMMDLILVNIIAVTLDIITVILVYLNQLGISHPVQTLSYIIKLKLEFMVLNQLMALTARGIQKQSWEERRYQQGSLADAFSAEARTAQDKQQKDMAYPKQDDWGRLRPQISFRNAGMKESPDPEKMGNSRRYRPSVVEDTLDLEHLELDAFRGFAPDDFERNGKAAPGFAPMTQPPRGASQAGYSIPASIYERGHGKGSEGESEESDDDKPQFPPSVFSQPWGTVRESEGGAPPRRDTPSSNPNRSHRIISNTEHNTLSPRQSHSRNEARSDISRDNSGSEGSSGQGRPTPPPKDRQEHRRAN